MTKGQKSRLVLLQLLVIVSAIFEVLAVLSIGPFMTIVGNIDVINSNSYINQLYKLSNASSETEFLFYIGCAVLLLMFCAALTSIITIWKLSVFAASVGSEFGDRLYSYYLNIEYEYYTNINSSDLIKKISTEVNRVTDNILQPFVQINARIATILFISIFVFLYNPIVALGGVSIIFVAYLVLFSLVKNKLSLNGRLISDFSRKRFKLMNEGFGAVKEIQVLGRQDYFVTEFKESGKVFSDSYGSSNTLYNIPRYVMEFVVYSSMITLILLLISLYEADLSSVLPVLGVFGIAAFKLLPSFQQVYSGAAQIRSNLSAFDSLREDLTVSKNKFDKSEVNLAVKLNGDIKLENIFFKYKKSEAYTLKNISMVIPERSTIGIVGSSGSGKSTLLDILIGSLEISDGFIYIGNKRLDKSNLRTWQNSIGYVSQMSLIMDGSISENIAFGIDKIDKELVLKAAEMAKLKDWVLTLPDGFDTRVGENGVQISGGQRQRIAIARALYNDANFLFFDEATSALDGVTEEQIMQSISDMAGIKTIVMIAHRFNTIKDCDCIFYMEAGEIVDFGTYSQLIENNLSFRKMAGFNS